LRPIASSAEPINVADYEALAEERLEPGAYGYFAGGAWDEVTLRDSIRAFELAGCTWPERVTRAHVQRAKS
jgi:hypothetical protein